MVKHIFPICTVEQVIAEQQRRDGVFTKAAKEFASKVELDAGEVKKALVLIWCDYDRRVSETEGLEEGPKAKDALWSLAAKAEEMVSVIRHLGQHAVEAMNDPTMPQELIQAAEPFNLPDLDPYRTEFIHDDSDPRYEEDRKEWKLGGLWIIRLESIAKLARLQANQIEKLIAPGGRKSLADRVYGNPDNWLIEACMEFAEAHGCQAQATVLRMVQAIQDVAGRPKIGRKAVRNVAQTKRV